MSATVQVKSKPGEVPSSESISNSARPHGNAPADDENTHKNDKTCSPSINDIESLKQGIIKTSKDKVKAPYTILLVGGTGVGKSSVMEFIANVLLRNDISHYDFNILDHANEQGDSSDQSQTKSARLYEFTSTNGIMVRILDTPGFAETRNVQQAQFHKKVITNQIREQIDSVTAVLVLANGTVPRITVGVDYALSTLSEIFPSTLANNVAFMFTNVSDPLSWNFCQDTVPSALKDAPQFKIDNPFALQKKYLNIKDNAKVKRKATKMLEEVNSGEQNALGMLVDLFDWLDGLQPQRIAADQTQGTLAQVLGLLKRAKEKVRKGVWNVRGIFVAIPLVFVLIGYARLAN